ncbi:FKBP12-associated protein [Bachmanniomyces sp. S44760]|nr:FKBP12-associated protein [Bachmanniomyces sp. S44760]
MLVTCECQHLKQEMKCNASKTGEGNSKRTLKCDEECARLERNRRLASALNIDSDYKDNHIPYSSATLQAYQENIKWSQTQERELRVFAADDSEKRLRFKPMPPHQRAFLHSLAEDFGLDSESMDPDPYRHVALFKTPRFVKAPMKTLQECVRIQSSAAAAASEALEESRRLRDNNEPYNGFLLSGPKFGLTLEELRHNISTILDTASGLSFTISFLPSEEIVLKAAPKNPSTTLSAASIGASLKSLKTPLSSAITAQNLAISTQLVTLDSSLNIIRRDPDALGNSDGWSQVAAKAAGPRLAPKQMAVGSKSVYTVLGSRLMEQKKKKKEEEKKHREEDVVEDWMEEFKKDEEDEQEDQEDQEEGTKRLVVDNVEGGVSTDAAENVNGNKEIEKEREKAVVTEEKKTEEVRAV